MARLHRIDRRTFLADLGKGTLAVAVFGTTAIACSSDGGDDADTTSGDPSSTEPTTSTTAAGEVDSDEEREAESEESAAPVDDRLRYERVSFGFVSAYLLLRGSEAAVVDTGNPGGGAAITDALAAADSSWDQVGHVILTHHHGDHVGGLGEVMGLATGANAYAGAADIGSISAPVELQAVDDGDEVFGMQIVATPGHTPGHISVLDPDGALLVAGDALNGADGGGVAGPNPDFSSDIDEAIASARKLGELQYAAMLPGHGDPVTDGASDAVKALAATL